MRTRWQAQPQPDGDPPRDCRAERIEEGVVAHHRSEYPRPRDLRREPGGSDTAAPGPAQPDPPGRGNRGTPATPWRSTATLDRHDQRVQSDGRRDRDNYGF